MYFLLPVLAALLLAAVLGFVTQRHQIRRLRRARALLTQKSMLVRSANRRESLAVEKAERATRSTEELQLRLAVTESRVQEQLDADKVEQIRQQIIEEERKRMLAAHAKNLGLKHLPKGVISNEADLQYFKSQMM